MKEAGAAAVPGPGRRSGTRRRCRAGRWARGGRRRDPPAPEKRPRLPSAAVRRAAGRIPCTPSSARASTSCFNEAAGRTPRKTIELDRGVGTLDPQRRGDCRERWHPTAAATAAAFDAGPVEGADLAPPHPGVVELEPVLQRCRAGGQLPSHRRAVEPHRPVLTRRSPRGTPRRRPPCRGYRQHSC